MPPRAEPDPKKEQEKRPVCHSIKRSVLISYAKFVAGQLLWHRHMANICEQKLRVLNDRGIMRDGVADDWSIADLMNCKIVEG